MGLIQKIKELFSAKAYIQKMMEEIDRKQQLYAAMSTEELTQLSDEDLLSAALFRADKKMDDELGKNRKGSPAEWVRVLSDEMAAVYALAEYDATMLHGDGLAEFFEEDNRFFAPHLARYLSTVGAEAHLALFEGFVNKNGVDLNNTAHFPSPATKEAVRLFNLCYWEIPLLEHDLVRFLRLHVEKI